jgi:hypothetical protein
MKKYIQIVYREQNMDDKKSGSFFQYPMREQKHETV